jgi:hypothetical protein
MHDYLTCITENDLRNKIIKLKCQVMDLLIHIPTEIIIIIKKIIKKKILNRCLEVTDF